MTLAVKPGFINSVVASASYTQAKVTAHGAVTLGQEVSLPLPVLRLPSTVHWALQALTDRLQSGQQGSQIRLNLL